MTSKRVQQLSYNYTTFAARMKAIVSDLMSCRSFEKQMICMELIRKIKYADVFSGLGRFYGPPWSQGDHRTVPWYPAAFSSLLLFCVDLYTVFLILWI